MGSYQRRALALLARVARKEVAGVLTRKRVGLEKGTRRG
jgi:hypothetical protein